jgi:3-hydroxyacyl-[acyl-carrier-protein] dehydratase
LDHEKTTKKYRKKPILDMGAASMTSVSYNTEDIKKLIPQREPFLLLDRIEGVDLEQEGIVGSRRIDPEDPIFKGHFPDYPILPGVLQIEMIGQLSICLSNFHRRQCIEIDEKPSELGVRALKIYHTLFQHEVLPGDEVRIMGKLIEKDDYTFKSIGQVLNQSKICTIAIAEFYIL